MNKVRYVNLPCLLKLHITPDIYDELYLTISKMFAGTHYVRAEKGTLSFLIMKGRTSRSYIQV